MNADKNLDENKSPDGDKRLYENKSLDVNKRFYEDKSLNHKNESYDDLINIERPWPRDVLRKHPKMSLQDRAKIFAPFAALRGHNERLREEDAKLQRSKRTESSEEKSNILSNKLRQVKKGMIITVIYFLPDMENENFGYNITATGIVSNIDPIYHILKINTGRTNEKGVVDDIIFFDDLIDISGNGISIETN